MRAESAATTAATTVDFADSFVFVWYRTHLTKAVVANPTYFDHRAVVTCRQSFSDIQQVRNQTDSVGIISLQTTLRNLRVRSNWLASYIPDC